MTKMELARSTPFLALHMLLVLLDYLSEDLRNLGKACQTLSWKLVVAPGVLAWFSLAKLQAVTKLLSLLKGLMGEPGTSESQAEMEDFLLVVICKQGNSLTFWFILFNYLIRSSPYQCLIWVSSPAQQSNLLNLANGFQTNRIAVPSQNPTLQPGPNLGRGREPVLLQIIWMVAFVNQNTLSIFRTMKTPSEKSYSLCSSKSNPLTDRFITNRSKDSKRLEKCKDINNVMGRLEMFENGDPQTPGLLCLGEKIVQQVQRMRSVPTRNFRCLQSFEVVKAPPEPYDNLIDWSSTGVLAVGAGSEIQVSNLKHYSTVMTRNRVGKIHSLSFQDEGLILASGDTNGVVQIWDIIKQYSVRNIDHFHRTSGASSVTALGHQGEIHSLLWNSSDLYTGSTKSICRHDLSISKTVTQELKKCNNVAVQSMDFSNNKIVAGYNDGSVAIWDVRTGNVIGESLPVGERGGFSFVKWCPWRVNHLVCGYQNRVVVCENQDFHVKYQHKVSETVTGLRVNTKDHQILYCTSYPSSHVVLLTEDLLPITSLPSFKNDIVGVCLSSDQKSICALSASKFGKVWNIGQRSKSSKHASRPKKSSKFSMR